MKITPHEQESDFERIRVEAVQQEKHEYHLIGSERKTKGHTLFSFNIKTRELKVAPVKRDMLMGMTGAVVYRNKVAVEKDCIYIQALNEKNARRKIQKLKEQDGLGKETD